MVNTIGTAKGGRDNCGRYLTMVCTKCRGASYKLIQEMVLFIVTFAYIILLALLYLWEEEQDEGYILRVFRIIDLVILIVFLLDLIIRIVAAGRTFFHSLWNVVDMIVILTALGLVGAIVGLTEVKDINYKPDDGMVFTMRFLRVILLFNRSQQLMKIYLSIKDQFQVNQYSTNLEKTLAIMKGIKENYALEPSSKRDMEWLMHMLATNEIHATVLAKKTDIVNGDDKTKEGDSWVLENFSTGGSSSNDSTKKRKQVRSVEAHPAMQILQKKVSTDLGVLAGDIGEDLGDEGGFVNMLVNASLLQEDHIVDILQRVNNWNFDIFDLDRSSAGHSVIFIAYCYFQTYSLMETFKIQEPVARRYFACVEAGYRIENEYHNHVHAADVMHNAYVFLSQNEFRKTLVASDILGILIAAAIHDYDHPGVNNAFLITTKSDIALMYNDRSVLENHHCAGGFYLMRQDDRNILESLSKELAMEMRESIISMVLATDMKYHFEEVGKFNAFISEVKMKGPDYPYSSKDRQFLLRMALHTADVANPAKPLEIMKGWTVHVMNEFFNQGDKEKALGLPVSQFMERADAATAIPKCQIGFITYIVQPTFDAWCKLTTGLSPIINANLQKTLAYWKDGSNLVPVVGSSLAGATTPSLSRRTLSELEDSAKERRPSMDVVQRRGSKSPNPINARLTPTLDKYDTVRIVSTLDSAKINQSPKFGHSEVNAISTNNQLPVILDPLDGDTVPPSLPSTRTLTELHAVTKLKVPSTPKVDQNSKPQTFF